MKHQLFAALAAFALSLSAMAADPNPSTGTPTETTSLRGKPTKEQVCDFTIDQKGVKRMATEQQKQTCEKTASDAATAPVKSSKPTP